MSAKQNQERLAETLRSWQRIENRGIAQTAEIMDKTTNPFIRLVMEMIQRDSATHHRVQQFILDSLEKEAVTFSIEDLEQIWDALQVHLESEKKSSELAAAAQKALGGGKDAVQKYLLEYLAADEKKHDKLLEDLAMVKLGMYKSA